MMNKFFLKREPKKKAKKTATKSIIEIIFQFSNIIKLTKPTCDANLTTLNILITFSCSKLFISLLMKSVTYCKIILKKKKVIVKQNDCIKKFQKSKTKTVKLGYICYT